MLWMIGRQTGSNDDPRSASKCTRNGVSATATRHTLNLPIMRLFRKCVRSVTLRPQPNRLDHLPTKSMWFAYNSTKHLPACTRRVYFFIGPHRRYQLRSDITALAGSRRLAAGAQEVRTELSSSLGGEDHNEHATQFCENGGRGVSCPFCSSCFSGIQ